MSSYPCAAQSPISPNDTEQANKILASRKNVIPTKEVRTLSSNILKKIDVSADPQLRISLAVALHARTLLPDIFLEQPLDNFSVKSSALVGEGSFGKVYKGKFKGEDVAVKVVREEALAVDMHILWSFFKEVQHWKSVGTLRKVTPFYGCFVTVEEAKEKQELILGLVSPLAKDNLTHYDVRNNTFQHTYRLLLDVAIGLSELHDKDLVHGDLSQENVLLFDGVAKLVDFGLMKKEGLISSYTLRGALQSLRPETVGPEVFIDRADRSTKSDIFAFGSLVYQLFAREYPFFTKNRFSTPERPKGMKEPLWDLVCKCWERQPQARPAAQEVVTILDTIMSDTKTREDDLISCLERLQ